MALLMMASSFKLALPKVAAKAGKAAGIDSSSLIALAASATMYSSLSPKNA